MADPNYMDRMRATQQRMAGARDATMNAARSWGNRFSQTYIGRQTMIGAQEAFGYNYTRKLPGGGTIPGLMSSRAIADPGGWMGLRGNMNDIYGGGVGSAVMSSDRALGQQGLSYMSQQGSGKALRLAGRTAMAGAGLAFTGYFAYQGWREEGLWGAAKGVGESVVGNIAARVGVSMLANPFGLAAAATVGAGVGMYALGEKSKEHVKSLKRTEFATTQMIDALGSAGAATMRQRSVMALQNTHINGRMALGNEALLMRTSYLG